MRRRAGQAVPACGWTLVLVAVVLSCGSIPDDELTCEEAVSRLIDCCPGFDPRRMPCVRSDGCGNDQTKPSFSEDSSRCILGKTCDDLRAGTCERVIRGSVLPHIAKGDGTA